MGTYTPTAADRLPLPASRSTEPRYLGYPEDDHRKPYAKYFKPDTLPVQDHVRAALLAGMAPTEWGYDLDDAAHAGAARLPQDGDRLDPDGERHHGHRRADANGRRHRRHVGLVDELALGRDCPL